MAEPVFLSRDEVAHLTGRKMKNAQIRALKNMGIAHFVNATGQAIVTKVAIEGRKHSAIPHSTRGWSPAVLKAK